MNTMSLQEFVELVGIHGGDPARWPEPRRTEAMQLLASADGEAARAALHEAAALDAALALYQPPPPSPALRRALLTRERRGWLQRLWDEFGGARVAGPAFAMALAAGVALAEVTTPLEADTADEDLIGLALLDEPYEEYAP